MKKYNKVQQISFSIFVGGVFLVYFLPSLYAGLPTSFASINNDLIFYLSIPEWLIEKSYFSFSVSDSFHPFFSIAEIHFSRFSRVGADYFNTLGMTFFNTDAIHTFNVISCFFVFLFSLSVYYTCKYSFRFSNEIVFTAVILVTINTLLFWMFTTQYMPQIGGNAFYVLSAGFIYRIINEKSKTLILPTCLSISGLIAVYSEYSLYLFIPAIIFLGISGFRDFRNMKSYVKILAWIIPLVALLNPVSTFLAVKYNYFAYTSTQNSTGIVEYIPFINQVLMVFGFKSLDYSLPSGMHVVLAMIFLVFVALGLLKMGNKVKLYLLVYSIFIISLFLYLNFINKFPYGYYKTLMFSQPFAIILFSIGLNFLITKYSILKNTRIILVGFLLIINLLQISKLEKVILTKGLLVTNEYNEIKEINNLIPKNEILSIENVTKDEEHILSFLLKDTKISFKNSNSYFAPSSIPEELRSNYTLKGRGDILNYSSSLIWHNEKMNLYKNFNVSLTEGWHGLENWNGVPSRWTESEFEITVKSQNSTSLSIQFTPVLPPNITERTLLIYVNDRLTETIRVEDHKEMSTAAFDIELNVVNKIKFIVKEGAVQVGQDTRALGIAMQNVEIIN